MIGIAGHSVFFFELNLLRQTDTMKRSLTKVILLALLIAVASGCSWSKKDKEPKQKPLTDYRESREISALEIPPDLSSDATEKSLTVPKYQQTPPTSTTTSPSTSPQTYPMDAVVTGEEKSATYVEADESTSSTDTKVAPKMYIERAGSQRWLVVHRSYSETFSDARDFVLSSGLALEREDKDAGILETGWANNYATEVLSGMQKWLNKGLGSIYTTPTRDKYRIRIEPGRLEGTSEVFISHKGMIEKVLESNNTADPVRTVWESVPPDATLEAEMLALLMVDMGASEATATKSLASSEKAPDRASIVTSANGQPGLVVDDQIEIAWRRVGQTLDRVGFSVEDRDAGKREYYVRYADPEFSNKKPGFFSKMFKKDKAVDEDIYKILLTDQGEKTAVDVSAKDGTPAPENVTTQIIKLLYEQLR